MYDFTLTDIVPTDYSLQVPWIWRVASVTTSNKNNVLLFFLPESTTQAAGTPPPLHAAVRVKQSLWRR